MIFMITVEMLRLVLTFILLLKTYLGAANYVLNISEGRPILCYYIHTINVYTKYVNLCICIRFFRLFLKVYWIVKCMYPAPNNPIVRTFFQVYTHMPIVHEFECYISLWVAIALRYNMFIHSWNEKMFLSGFTITVLLEHRMPPSVLVWIRVDLTFGVVYLGVGTCLSSFFFFCYDDDSFSLTYSLWMSPLVLSSFFAILK